MTTATKSPAESYVGAITSAETEAVMRDGSIIPPSAGPNDLLKIVAQRLAQYDAKWVAPHQAVRFADTFVNEMLGGRLTLGSPALTNMWESDQPFASCAAVPPTTDANLGPAEQEQLAEDFYMQNMGSGFNLDSYEDPVSKLLHLNDHAAMVQASGSCERYVGNMAHVSADHPEVRKFLRCKVNRRLPHFNISVNFTELDFSRIREGDHRLNTILADMSAAAWECGDPGLISLDRFNARNPLAQTSPYLTTAPCAEVGLAAGDTCLFAYINVAAFAKSVSAGDIDYDSLTTTVGLAVRGLDDLLDADAEHLTHALSRSLAARKRRIGIGICGFADLLLWQGIPYGSPQSIKTLKSVLSVIHFAAVQASCDLAEARGSFPAFEISDWRLGRPSPPPSDQVSARSWSDLYKRARQRGIRHSVVTALPPSGRSALLLRVNTSIEPFLRDPRESALKPELQAHARLLHNTVSRSAIDIPWTEHLDVLQCAIAFLDESASKTVNLAPGSSVSDVEQIFRRSVDMGLRAISVYRSMMGG